ncbi:MAG: RNA methyltransferase [Deltaproteobacteria bacterium]|nr:RNA methyltransferase [Deltaproteobacteria bacterium]
MGERPTWLATAARGTEPILARELRALGAEDVREESGGVAFAGRLELALRCNLRLRTANHVLLRLASFPIAGPDELYAGASEVPWEEHLTVRSTFAVFAHGRAEGIGHTGFAALRVKDAIADRIRGRKGERPDVDPRDPAVRVVVHLASRSASLFLDTSGDSLHRRGYRVAQTEAPLRETLAAALVLWSGWDRRRPLCDPMCGSGTIAIEAALLARGRAPGLGRRFGFQRWPAFGEVEARAWRAMVQEAREEAAAGDSPVPVWASDVDRHAVEATRANAEAAGVAPLLHLAVADARRFDPPGPSGMVLANPPYGERLSPGARELASLYRALGRSLRPPGWVTILLSGHPSLPRLFGGRPTGRLPLRNGALRCELLRWETGGERRED